MAEPSGIRDARGRELPPGERRRLVSLVPSLTETVVELGAAGRLVGRTRFCIHPADVLAGVPAVGGPRDPDLEAVAGLRPDLVLACLEENRAMDLAALEAAGVPVHAVHPRRLDDVDALLADYGRLLGAGEAAAAFRADLAAARREAAAPRRAAPRRAATLVWKDPWLAAGGGTYIDAVMAELGLVNVYGDHEGYGQTTLVELAGRRPALVLLPSEPYAFGPAEVDALAAAGVAPPARALPVEGESLTWYGTRTPRALRALAALLAAGTEEDEA
ncbi:MAG: ABC transporter substrate-binding protein [Candidatus Krumholzibacteriota bacterium]|nr:ABC transporter substrate-binding protein [Candidatus Krumholzibacteriota bacterium]